MATVSLEAVTMLLLGDSIRDRKISSPRKRGSKLFRLSQKATRRNLCGTSRLQETSDLTGSFKREESSLMLMTTKG